MDPWVSKFIYNMFLLNFGDLFIVNGLAASSIYSLNLTEMLGRHGETISLWNAVEHMW